MNLVRTWLDNPIFVKHLRSRLRRGQVIPPAAVVFLLCLMATYPVILTGSFAQTGTIAWYLGLQSFLLIIFGANRVASVIAGARESGIIDFHRVSPLSATAVTLGFFFGAPVREYLLAAITLPFCLACAASAAPSFGDLIAAEVGVLLIAWLVQGFALLAALATKKPKAGATAWVGLLIFGGTIGSIAVQAYQARRGFGPQPPPSFFGWELPGIALALIYALPPIGFLLLASTRKMRSERAHALTKPEAVAGMAIHAALVVGFVWSLGDSPALAVLVDYVLVVLAMVMAVTITPTRSEYAKGVRRGDREGPGRISPWDSLALNRLALGAIGLIVLAGGEATARGIAMHPAGPATPWGVTVAPTAPISTTLSTAAAVLTVAYFGLGWQCVKLASPKRGGGLFGLFLFVAWGVPLALALIVASAGSRDGTSQVIAALSPIAGIALAALPEREGGIAIQAAAIGPPIVFAFLFNNLVSRVRRKVQVEVRGGSKPPVAPADGIEFPEGLTID